MKINKIIYITLILSAVVKNIFAPIDSIAVLNSDNKKVVVIGVTNNFQNWGADDILKNKKDYQFLLSFIVKLSLESRNSKIVFEINNKFAKFIKLLKAKSGYMEIFSELSQVAEANYEKVGNVDLKMLNIHPIVLQMLENFLFSITRKVNTPFADKSDRAFLDLLQTFGANAKFYGFSTFITIEEYLNMYIEIFKTLEKRLENLPGSKWLLDILSLVKKNLNRVYTDVDKKTKLIDYWYRLLSESEDLAKDFAYIFKETTTVNRTMLLIDYLIEILESQNEYIVAIVSCNNARPLVTQLVHCKGFKLAAIAGPLTKYTEDDKSGLKDRICKESFHELLDVNDLTDANLTVDQNITALESYINKLNQPTIAKTCGYCKKKDCEASCGRCKAVFYCDRSCQANHWIAGHAKECAEFCKNRMQE